MLGETRLNFSVGGIPTSDQVVTDEVTEFFLGMDFMCANDCEWLVSNILSKGHSVPLVKNQHKANVHSVIV